MRGSFLGAVSTMNRIEKIGTITLNAINTPYNLSNNGGLLPNDRFMKSLKFRVRGRLTNAGANNPTGVQADGLFNLIERITVEGYHRPRAAQEKFIDLRGPELRELNRNYTAIAPQETPVPLVTGAGLTNDFEFLFSLPFVPMGVPIQNQVGWLLDAPNYDRLQLTIYWADDKNVFTGQTSASTFSAYGSASGSPTIDVHGEFVQAGPSRFQGFVPGRIWRYALEATGSVMTTTATAQRIFNVPKGYKIRGLFIKTGVKSTAVTAGNNAYNTLSDTIFANPYVFRGANRINRWYSDPAVVKAYNMEVNGIRPSTGYHLIDYVTGGWDGELLDTTNLVAGPTGDVDVYYQADVTGVAAQAALMMIEEWRFGPSQVLARR